MYYIGSSFMHTLRVPSVPTYFIDCFLKTIWYPQQYYYRFMYNIIYILHIYTDVCTVYK